MGQQEIYSFLKRHKNRWFSSKELIENLKLSSGSTTMSLMKLRKAKIIQSDLKMKATKSGNKRKIFVYRFRKGIKIFL